jgi:hypothetical protein
MAREDDAGGKAAPGGEGGVEGKEAARGAGVEASFTSLVLMFSSSAWVALGKIADPVSGEVKRDLEGAHAAIELLVMLREKTRGNLGRDEERVLNGVIADLQANYAETVFSEGGTPGQTGEKKP